MMDRRSQFLRISIPNLALRAVFGSGLVAAALTWNVDAHAQATPRFPFPSSNTTALRTGALTTHELRAQYQSWKERFLQTCGDGSIRVQYPENEGNDTRSEGVGYGMVIAAYMGDKPTFDGLLAYWQRFDNNNLMNWRTFGCDGGSENGSASDADVDAALGLIVADAQWGGYAAQATAIISSIRTAEFLNCNGRSLLDPGSDGNFGNCGCMNPSYFAPGYYSAFATFDGANAGFWNGAVTSAYATLDDIQNAQSGLVPAWSSAAQVQIQNCTFQVDGGGAPNTYQSDAARTPWRVATDFAWTGSQAARAFLAPMINWLNTSNRLTHIVDVYALNGGALMGTTQLNNMTLDATGRRSTITMGAFASAGVAGTQAELDRLVGAWLSLYRAGDDLGPGGISLPHAFNNSLALLYGMLATGTMWDPLGDDPTPLREAELRDQPGNVIVNGDFDEGFRGWTMENLGGAAAEGYSIHESGQLHVFLQKVTGIAEDNYMVRLRQPVTLQAGQNYRISVRASAAQPRLMRMFVGQRDAPYATYLSLDDDPEAEGASINLTTDMQTFTVVQQAEASSGAVQLALDFADSMADVIIDDIVLAPTTDPVTAEGAPVVNPPGTPAPGTTPGTPSTPGAPAGMNGTIGTVNPNGDATGAAPGAPGAPNPNTSTAGLPAAPTTPPGAGSCTAANPGVCAPALCSPELGLCYEQTHGYVWDPTRNDYAQPPRGVLGCGPDQVYWPLYKLCYIPETGFIFNTQTMKWEFYGIDYTAEERPQADSTCSVGGVPGRDAGANLLLVGLFGAALGLTVRRRAA